MKKILFIQLKGKSYGGVWQVIKSVGESLIQKGYDVEVISLRENHDDIVIEHDPKLKLITINQKDIWENTYTGKEIIYELKKIHLIEAVKRTIIRIKHEISIKRDIKKLHKHIYAYNPDYIITAQYQLINMIPKDLLNITIHEQHISFRESINHKDTKRVFDKYKDKIHFLWLTKQTMLDAIEYGITNSHYIYNPVRFKSDKVAKVAKNKKLITIARISPQKRIDKMVLIAKEVFKDKKYQDWTLEIYGNGPEEDKIKKTIGEHKQIKLMGVTNEPKKELLNASINLNTSDSEGFCLSILEANECGVPTVTLDFGESVNEEIIDGKTGIIANDQKDYIKKLKELMDNPKKLQELAINAKEFSKEFQPENITEEWIKLFNSLYK